MLKVVIIKDGKFFHGNAVEASMILGVCAETIRRWYKIGDPKIVRGYNVYVSEF